MKNYFDVMVNNVERKTTIYQYLRQAGFSEHYLKNLRNDDKILLNSEIANMRSIIKNEDIISIDKNPYEKTEIKISNQPLDIIYEDEFYLVVNKPTNLATNPTRSHYDDNLSARICGYMANKDDNFTLRVMNRLDMDVSGIIIVAKDAVTYQFTENIEKTYYAVCNGKIAQETIIDSPILTETVDGINVMKRKCSPLGQTAKTTLIPIKHNQNNTLLEVHIEKGRTHQIRVHSSHIGHSLVGDTLYCPDDNLENEKKFNRIYLHLGKISFYNKINKKLYNFDLPYPTEFNTFF